MALAATSTVALVGTEARLVHIEIHVAGSGIPGVTIVGLPARSVTESGKRIQAAIEAIGLQWPQRRITANLAPGSLRKEGTHFDLPMALGVLAGHGQIASTSPSGWVAMGELALDGTLRAVPGVLAAAIASREAGRRGLLCPASNAPEAALVDGIEVVAVRSLREAVDFLAGTWDPPEVARPAAQDLPPIEDMCEVRGQERAKRALEIAAAGGHNLLMIGPPGSGKTMLARRFGGILPAMSMEEALEVTRIYSVAGLLGGKARLIVNRPFRSPHHGISLAGLIGGGPGLPRPGEISLAHPSIAICY